MLKGFCFLQCYSFPPPVCWSPASFHISWCTSLHQTPTTLAPSALLSQLQSWEWGGELWDCHSCASRIPHPVWLKGAFPRTALAPTLTSGRPCQHELGLLVWPAGFDELHIRLNSPCTRWSRFFDLSLHFGLSCTTDLGEFPLKCLCDYWTFSGFQAWRRYCPQCYIPLVISVRIWHSFIHLRLAW